MSYKIRLTINGKSYGMASLNQFRGDLEKDETPGVLDDLQGRSAHPGAVNDGTPLISWGRCQLQIK